MTWFKVCDTFAFHHKSIQAGNAALGLWVRAGSWCGQHLTDGYIPAEVVRTLGTQAQAGRLVKSGLWLETDGGYQFHDWGAFNPLAADVQSARKQAAVKQKIWRESRKNLPGFPEKPSSDGAVTGNVTNRVTGNSGTGIGSSSSTGRKTVTLLGTDQDPDFVAFWNAYPRKIGKGNAREAWKRAITKRGADPKAMVEAAEQFGTERSGENVRFTPHPATWLNGERYLDAPSQSEQELPWWEES